MNYKRKIVLSVIGMALSLALLITSAFLAEYERISPVAAIILNAVSVLAVLLAISYAVKVDYGTGVYVCRACGHTFKPTFKAYVWAAHTLTTRHLTCPKCEKKSWCKRKSIEQKA